MKIAISGTACVGKSTFIDDLLKAFPHYHKADNSYRDIAKKDPKVILNDKGNKESQNIILNALIDDTQQYPKGSNILFDRSVYDNLVYSMYLNYKGIGDVDDMYIEKTISLVREAGKVYDIIFFIPILEQYPIEIVPDKDGQRSLDPVFRSEIDNIFKSLYKSYQTKKLAFFDFDDCPAVIEIYGSREERVELAKMYVDCL